MSTQLDPLRRQLAPRPYPSRRSEERGPLVFASGKGGTGTSTLATLLAIRAASTGTRVLLVDGTGGPGSLHLILGVEAGQEWTAMKSGTAPDALLVEVTQNLSLLPGGGGAGETIAAAERQILFRKISSLYSRFDLVVIDGGSRLESVVAACAPGAGRLIAVTTADRVSLAATYALVKVVGGRLPELPVTVLANRSDGEAAESVRAAVRRFLDRSLDGVGSIPDDECLRAGVNAGMNIQDAAADSPAAAAMIDAATRFVRGLRTGSAAGDTLQFSRRS